MAQLETCVLQPVTHQHELGQVEVKLRSVALLAATETKAAP